MMDLPTAEKIKHPVLALIAGLLIGLSLGAGGAWTASTTIHDAQFAVLNAVNKDLQRQIAELAASGQAKDTEMARLREQIGVLSPQRREAESKRRAEIEKFIQRIDKEIHQGKLRLWRSGGASMECDSKGENCRWGVKHAQDTSRLLKAMRGRDDPGLLERLIHDLALSPVRMATDAMEASGILDALDDAPDLILGELRRSAIPNEDEEYLRGAGFDVDDVEILLALAVYRAPALVSTGKLPSNVAEEAIEALDIAVQVFINPPEKFPAKKKRKIFNGIGKLLGGAVAGIGNALLVAGTLVAPNPATGYGAIVSGGIAVTSFFAGLGDLKGE